MTLYPQNRVTINTKKKPHQNCLRLAVNGVLIAPKHTYERYTFTYNNASHDEKNKKNLIDEKLFINFVFVFHYFRVRSMRRAYSTKQSEGRLTLYYNTQILSIDLGKSN